MSLHTKLLISSNLAVGRWLRASNLYAQGHLFPVPIVFHWAFAVGSCVVQPGRIYLSPDYLGVYTHAHNHRIRQACHAAPVVL